MHIRFSATLILLGCLGVFTPGTARAGGAPPKLPRIGPVPTHQQATQAAPALPNGYVGADTCVTCHDGEGKSLSHTEHGRAANPRTPMAGMGCESCHGPGKAHVDADGDITKIRVDLEPGLRQTMMQKTGRRTVPQIYIGDFHVGGYDDLVALDHAGRLAPLLAGDHAG